jgi:hypothetical protein
MWFRFTYITIFKWAATTIISFVLSAKILPLALTGYWLSLPLWIIVFLLSFGFAYWALMPRMPGRRETALLLTVWFLTTFLLQIGAELYIVGKPLFIVYDRVLHVQYFLELVAILLAAYLVRMKKIHAVLGEGMTE